MSALIVVFTTARDSIAVSRCDRAEAVEPGRQRDVRRRRVLALQRGEAADRLGGSDALALDQQLPRRERRGELGAAQDAHRTSASASGRERNGEWLPGSSTSSASSRPRATRRDQSGFTIRSSVQRT